MSFRYKSIVMTLGVMTALQSCTKEFNDIDTQILPGSSFLFESESFGVEVSHHQIGVVRTDNLGLYQLGHIEDPFFGKTSARYTTQISLPLTGGDGFGSVNAEIEANGLQVFSDIGTKTVDRPAHDEQETVTEVRLEIPYATNQRDSDGDGVIDALDADPNDPNSDSDGDNLTDIEESRSPNNLDPLKADTDEDGINDDVDEDTVNPDPNASSYEIDLIYGNIEQVHFSVHKSDYYLRALDPNANFEEGQAYFSDFDLLQRGLAPTVLFDGDVTLDFDEIPTYKVDDPATEEDESEEEDVRLSPMLRITLQNTALFQDILDKEGASELSNNEFFNEYFQGLVLSIAESDPMMMQLNFSAGQLVVKYDYQNNKLVDDGDASNQDDYIAEAATDSLSFPMSGIRFNTFAQTGFSAEVSSAVSGNDNQENIYLKGGSGVMAQIDLFSGTEGQALLEDLQSRPWLINEANLVLYVDQSKTALMGDIAQPERLYLYDLTNQTPITDYNSDTSSGNYSDQTKTSYGGIPQLDDSDNIVSYKFRLTKHVSNLLRNPEDFENVSLGLSVTSNILNIATTTTSDNTEVPAAMIANPLGTVLAGPNHSNPDLRLKLEVFYTEYEE